MRNKALALAAALALVAVSACGDDESTTVTTTVTETAADTTTDTDGDTTTDTPPPDLTTESTDFEPRPCPGADSPPNITNVTSYGADCEAVEAAMAKLRTVSKMFRLGDFECFRLSGNRLGGIWECRGEASFFTFEFGD